MEKLVKQLAALGYHYHGVEGRSITFLRLFEPRESLKRIGREQERAEEAIRQYQKRVRGNVEYSKEEAEESDIPGIKIRVKHKSQFSFDKARKAINAAIIKN